MAGKEVDVSIFDVERVLARGPGEGTGKEAGSGTGGKRKKGKGELEDGEVWRARNVSPRLGRLKESAGKEADFIMIYVFSCRTTV